MPDRGDAYGLLALDHLVDDAVGTDAQGSQPAEPASELVARVGLAFQQAQSLLDRVDQRRFELEQLASGAPREHDTSHRSARAAKLGEFLPEILERDRFVSTEFVEAGFDRLQCRTV